MAQSIWVLVLLQASSALELAKAHEVRGDDSAAMSTIQQAVSADCTWAMGRIELGRLLLKSGEVDAAMGHLDVARTLAPDNPRAHYLFALAADENGRQNESRRALEVALALRDGYADAQVRLAGVLGRERDYLGAAAVLKMYLLRNPAAHGARLQLAQMLEGAGDLRGAEVELRQAFAMPQVRVVAGRRLAALLEQQGRTQDAAQVYQQLQSPTRRLRELPRSRR